MKNGGWIMTLHARPFPHANFNGNEPRVSWQPIIFSASSHVHSKSRAQSHASSRGRSPDRSHDTSRDTSHDLLTQHWSRDMTSQSRRF